MINHERIAELRRIVGNVAEDRHEYNHLLEMAYDEYREKELAGLRDARPSPLTEVPEHVRDAYVAVSQKSLSSYHDCILAALNAYIAGPSPAPAAEPLTEVSKRLNILANGIADALEDRSKMCDAAGAYERAAAYHNAAMEAQTILTGSAGWQLNLQKKLFSTTPTPAPAAEKDGNCPVCGVAWSNHPIDVCCRSTPSPAAEPRQQMDRGWRINREVNGGVEGWVGLYKKEAGPNNIFGYLHEDEAELIAESPKCRECNGTGTVNTFDGKDTGSNTAENWPGPCPKCQAEQAGEIDPMDALHTRLADMFREKESTWNELALCNVLFRLIKELRKRGGR